MTRSNCQCDPVQRSLLARDYNIGPGESEAAEYVSTDKQFRQQRYASSYPLPDATGSAASLVTVQNTGAVS